MMDNIFGIAGTALNAQLTLLVLMVVPVCGWILLLPWIPVWLFGSIRAAVAAGSPVSRQSERSGPTGRESARRRRPVCEDAFAVVVGGKCRHGSSAARNR